jgi:spore maturation protein CgeB
MKILVTGHHNPLYLTYVEYLENAIRHLSHDLIPFDDRQFLLPGRLRQRIKALQNFDLKHMNTKLLSLVRDRRPDLVIITQGHLWIKDTVKKIKDLGIPVVLWVIDAPTNFHNILDSSHSYDFVFCGGTEAIEILASHGIKKLGWLPFACSPDFHFPPAIVDHGFAAKDVVFVGSHYPSRERLFEGLNLRMFDFGIWGSGWEKVPPDSPLKKHIQKTHTKPDEWVKVYSRSKIVLVAHYPHSANIPCYQASPKIYEAMACGSFIICDSQKDVRALFKDGEHLVLFQDLSDLNRKILFYLEHERERKMIAEKARQEALEKHTYLHRITEMIDTLHTEGILLNRNPHISGG